LVMSFELCNSLAASWTHYFKTSLEKGKSGQQDTQVNCKGHA